MPHSRHSRILAILVGLLLLVPSAPPARAYSVLSHEAIIDSAWPDHIRPLLLARFPSATQDELREAHAYCYGGAIIQDAGYYPYGKRLFSDLAHYVRSGDFVLTLLRDAKTLDELAFALGALAHYAADNEGHRIAVNLAVPILYPELKKKYGDVVTYENDPLAHVKTEFGFDVLEVAKGRFAPDAYRDFIGFEVAQPLLDRAFEETYGIKLSTLMPREERAINSYRHDVSNLIPRAVKVAWALKQDDIEKDQPGITRQKFLYNLSRASFEKRWGKEYRKPNFVAKLYAFFFRLIPKIGPLKILTFRTPTPDTERMFEHSFNVTLDRYRALLDGYGAGTLQLPNDNFDVGAATELGKYQLADDTYAALLHRLTTQNFSGVDATLRADILAFYSSPKAPPIDASHSRDQSRSPSEIEEAHKEHHNTKLELARLKSLSPAPSASPSQ